MSNNYDSHVQLCKYDQNSYSQVQLCEYDQNIIQRSLIGFCIKVSRNKWTIGKILFNGYRLLEKSI